MTFTDNALSQYSAIGNPYLFTARRWHSGIGLYYYRFRDYDPALGRFLQPDPAGYIDTLNLYAYCANNPVVRIDPFGKVWSLLPTGIGALSGGIMGLTHGLISEAYSAACGNGFSWGNVGKSTVIGAVGGAVAGAIAGALTGDPSALAIEAALLGGFGGGLATGFVQGMWEDPGWEDNTPIPLVGEPVINPAELEERQILEDQLIRRLYEFDECPDKNN